MASLRLQPPASFNFQQPDEWPRWKSRFEQFRAASGLSGEAEERQVSTLLYCLGENAEDVLNSTTISQTDRKKYDKVLEQFDTFFKVRRNVIFERARFNMRKQQPAESAEEYITTLYRLAETCEFGDLKEDFHSDFKWNQTLPSKRQRNQFVSVTQYGSSKEYSTKQIHHSKASMQ
jgi:hypothetical protein